MKRDIKDLVETYKRACPGYVLELWDKDDEKFIERLFSRNEDEDDRD